MAALRRLTASGLVVALLTGCAPVDILNATIPTGDISIERDIAFGADQRQRLDVYTPKSLTATAPVIVFFYGGTWQTGAKKDYLFAAEALAARGAIVVVPDYRVYPQVTYPGFLEDGAAATAWAMNNAAKFGGDPDRVFLMGHSAGAYIAIMLALDRQYLAAAGASTDRLAGAIGVSGPYDFLPLTRADVKPIFEVVPDMTTTQPIHYARADSPPLLLLTGDADTTVGPYNTRNLANRIRSLGGQVEDRYYPGVAHIGSILALAPLFRGKAPVLTDIEDFIAEHRHAGGRLAQPVSVR